MERFIAEEGIADPLTRPGKQAEIRSVEEAQKVFAAAPVYGVNYSALKK